MEQGHQAHREQLRQHLLAELQRDIGIFRGVLRRLIQRHPIERALILARADEVLDRDVRAV